jgi:hypothetical protein
MTEYIDMLNGHPALLEAASWRLCSEVARRYPDDLRIIETHPGGGQYDCLTLTSRHEPESLLDANRVGRIHAHPTAAVWTWWEYLSCPNPRGFVAEVADTLPFPTPRSVPAATAPTLTWRCITATLMSAVWTCTDCVRSMVSWTPPVATAGCGVGR